MLVMDFTEQLSSPHFLEAIKVDEKRIAEGFASGKTFKVLHVHFQL